MNGVESEFVLNSDLINSSWYNEFADKLLSENLLLTALEFYAELTESGKHLPKLKDFFSNPGNFENFQTFNKCEVVQPVNLPRSSSQVTLDSLDLTRYSEDGEKSTDDRVAVLEFELRKARETINALRTNLTEAAVESETNKSVSQENFKNIGTAPQSYNISIKPHEKRALNFLINEYLLLNGYKLTSITFADENENQDFDDWDDVGLNISRPVELLHLYREGLKGIRYQTYSDIKDFECQVSLYDEVKQNLQINELELEVEQLSNQVNSMKLEYSHIISSLGNEKGADMDSQTSATPEQECFEIIDKSKSNEESETSEKSNEDWTKIDSKFKREIIDQSNFETVICSDNIQNQSNSSDVDINTDPLQEVKALEDFQSEIESQISLGEVKHSDNLFERISDCVESETDKSKPTIKQDNSSKKMLELVESGREIPAQFKSEMLKFCDTFVPMFSSNDILFHFLNKKFLDGIELSNLVDVLSTSLQKIIPNIILNKREEITPLLILSICLNMNSSVRDKLLNLLFNLKKKPQAEERSVILKGLLTVAELKGSETVENEILPQCWEQINCKYFERRMLVAESCFVLAPYVSETIRNSLIISMAQQLLTDKEENVRKAAVYILTLLIALMSDKGKYAQVQEICLKILNDDSEDVINTANEVLLPTLAQWNFNFENPEFELFSKLLNKVENEKSLGAVCTIQSLLPYLVVKVADSNCLLKDTSTSHPPPAKRQEFCNLCKGLRNPAVFYNKSLGELMGAFDFYTSQSDFEPSLWPSLQWVRNIFVTSLLRIGDELWENSSFLKSLSSLLRYLCLGLGKNVTKQIIKPFLFEKLLECENAVVSGQDYKYGVIPLYLVGVLSTHPEELQEMSNTLRRFICALPLCGVSLIPLQVTVEILCQYQPWQILVLDALWEGVVHQRPLVRSGSAFLFQFTIPHIPESLLSTKIMPALVTLTSDSETSVRTSAVPSLGMLTKAQEKAIRDKVYLTFQALLQDGILSENNSLLIQLVKTLRFVYEYCDQKFREDVVIPQLFAVSGVITKMRSKELTEVLIETFSTVTFSQIEISPQCNATALLPGLRNLEGICDQLNIPFSERVDSMVKEVERRLPSSGEYSITKVTSKSPPTSDIRRSSNPVSAHVVVEDVRNRVTKMFNTRQSTLQNVSGIFKKKT